MAATADGRGAAGIDAGDSGVGPGNVLLPYLENRRQIGERSQPDVMEWSARPRDFLSAPRANILYSWTDSFGGPERHLFLGVTAAVLARRWDSPLVDRVRRIHAGHLVLGVLLASGFNAFLYPLLFDWVLPYRGRRLRHAQRSSCSWSLIGAGRLGLAAMKTRLGTVGRMAVATVAILLLFAEYFRGPNSARSIHRRHPGHSMLAKMEDVVVFEWPVSHPSRITERSDTFYMHCSTQHWKPLLNGYSGSYLGALPHAPGSDAIVP